jgi:hypothetical protein
MVWGDEQPCRGRANLWRKAHRLQRRPWEPITTIAVRRKVGEFVKISVFPSQEST